MAHQRFDLRALDDRQLLERLVSLHQTSAEVMADLLCHLAEVERRRLHVREASSSLFKYAVEVLHCTEDEAWRRVVAAQTAAKYPVIFEMVARGELTLTAVNRLRPVLTDDNHLEVLTEAKHKTKEQILLMVARLAPKPDVTARLTRVVERPRRSAEVTAPELPMATAPAGVAAQAPALALTAPVAALPNADPTATQPAAVGQLEATSSQPTPRRAPCTLVPLSPERWNLALTVGAAAHRALERARDLTPGRNLTVVIERAVIEYAEKLESRKLAKLKGRKRSERPVPETTSTEPAPSTCEASLKAPATSEAPATSAKPPEPSSGHAVVADVGAVDAATDTRVSAPARAPDHGDRRRSASARSRSGRPPIPRAVVREVVERDGGQCAYTSPETGRRCSETANLELHHIVPFARGGEPVASNLSLRCRSHNAHQAVLDFGAENMAEAVRRRRRHSPSERDRERTRQRV